MKELLHDIRNCETCSGDLPCGPRPVLTASPSSKIVVIGQAPGRIVHGTGIPWDDKSGDNLRSWMNVDKSLFYDPERIALIPMGFCYPGTGKSGDLPPRKECAPQWHPSLFEEMKDISLILLVGKYAQDYYLGKKAYSSLTETVRHFEEFLPRYFPLPHPSPRNNIWQAKHPWFKENVLPVLQKSVENILSETGSGMLNVD